MNPEQSEIMKKAVAEANAGRTATAIDLLSPCIDRRDDTELAVLRLAGLLYHRVGKLSKAAGLFQRVLKRSPNDVETRYNLGVTWQAQNQFQAARDCYAAVVHQAPDNFAAWFNLGVCCAKLKDSTQAIAAFEQAVALDVNHIASWRYLAVLLSGSREPRQLERACEAARKVLSAEPENASAWDALGVALFKLGRREEAYQAGARAVKAAPQSPAHYLHLAENCARAGESRMAEDVLREGLRILLDHHEIKRQLGITRLRENDAEAALELLNAALQQTPFDQRALAHKAVALQALKRNGEAQSLFGIDRFLHQIRLTDIAPFPTLAKFNEAFAEDIRQHPTLQFEPVGLAARGGSLTGELMEAPTKAIEVFERNLRHAIDEFRGQLDADSAHPFTASNPKQYRLNTWATLVPEGGEIASHIHEQSWLSGAYYVTLPETMQNDHDSRAGWIEFGRPSRDLPATGDEQLRWIKPEEGLLLLFPSYWFHRTLPFAGMGERISVSFDVEPV